MTSAFDTLIARVPDEQLRKDLQAAATEIRRVTDFGLVFEAHLPETVRLPHHPMRRGVKVTYRDGRDKSIFEVVRARGNEATIRRLRDPSGNALAQEHLRGEADERVALNQLIAIAEFGDPIYPGLNHLGALSRGGSRPAHIVINAENYHALQALQFTHAGKIDCIYIDPPYNSGARDWKYDNDYVDKEDRYRHSKWLAFMDRRLRLAKDLLNPESSVLIVTIDEKEYLRLGLLLEQVFPEARIEMVSSVINPKGTGRANDFGRTNEYLFYVRLGDVPLTPRRDDTAVGDEVVWETMRRRNLASRRGRKGKGACGPNQFYAIFVDSSTEAIVGRSDPLPIDVDRASVPAPAGSDAVFPVRPDGTEMNWEYTALTFDRLWGSGFIRANGARPSEPQSHIIQHLPNKARNEIEQGVVAVTGRREDGSVMAVYADATTRMVTTQWNFESHNAEKGGTNLLKSMIPGRPFPFPKSLYAVEDSLRIVLASKPNGIVLDFFAGSGTTGHAIARLNREDGGTRRSISVTNNEVSSAEGEVLRARGLQPGDAEWERYGIFEQVTRPRITAAVTGHTPEGDPILDRYRSGEEFSISEGLEENIEFFELTYLDAAEIEVDRAFAGIAPLLWLRAGGEGAMLLDCLDAAGRRKPYEWTDQYGILFNTDRWRRFVDKLPSTARTAYIVTDSNTDFAHIAGELPGHLDVVRLYERYLTTFVIGGR